MGEGRFPQRLESVDTGLEKVGAREVVQSESSAFGAGQWCQHAYQSGGKAAHHQQCFYFDRLPIELQQTMHTRYCQHTVTASEASTVYQQSWWHPCSINRVLMTSVDKICTVHAVSRMSVSPQHTVGGGLLYQQSKVVSRTWSQHLWHEPIINVILTLSLAY